MQGNCLYTTMMQNVFQQVLETAIHKMALVPREEFDIQCEVLKRTRQKLEELERQLAILEKSGL